MTAPKRQTWEVCICPKNGVGVTVTWEGAARSKQAAIQQIWSHHPDKKRTHKVQYAVVVEEL
jgi:hypothetical protein